MKVQHRGKNGRRGPYGVKIKLENDVQHHILSRTLTHIVSDNKWSMRVVPGKYKIYITYGGKSEKEEEKKKEKKAKKNN